MKDEILKIQITNKGAVIAVEGLAMMLIHLGVIKINNKNIKTVEELKNHCIEQLKKYIGWLDRENDKTIEPEEIEKAKKNGNEAVEMIKKLWID